MDPLQ